MTMYSSNILEVFWSKYIPLSIFMSKVTQSTIFNQVILIFVIIAGVLVGIQSYESLSEVPALVALDGVVLGVFGGEVVVKVVAEGRKPWRYFTGAQRWWNLFDFAIVALCLGDLLHSGGGSVAFLRMLRLVRVAKLFKQIPELQMIIVGLMLGLKSIVYIMMLLFLLFYLFAIVGVFLFRENDPGNFGDFPITIVSLFRISTLDDWTDLMYINMFGCDIYDGGLYFPSNSTQMFSTWLGSYYEFTCVSPGTQRWVSMVYFVVFAVFSAYVVLSLYIGAITLSMSDVLAEQYREKKRIEIQQTVSPSWLKNTVRKALNDKRIDETDFQADSEPEEAAAPAASKWGLVKAVAQTGVMAKRANNAQPGQLSRAPSKRGLKRAVSGKDLNQMRLDRGRVRRVSSVMTFDSTKSNISVRSKVWMNYLRMSLACRNLSSSRWFEGFMMLTICTAGVVVGISTAYETFWLTQIDYIILGIFTFELFVKVFAEGRKPWRYVSDPWNRFDSAIVFCSYLPLLPVSSATKALSSVVSAFRLMRVVRVLKLVQSLKQMKIAVEALMRGFSSMAYISLLMLIFFYMFGIVGMMLFKDNDPWHFGLLQDALLTLFRCATLEDWTDVMYINMWGCDRYGYWNHPELCVQPRALGWVATVYFLFFAIVGSMVLVKLFLGVVSTGMEQAALRSQMEDDLHDAINDAVEKHRITDFGVRLLYHAFMLLDEDDTGLLRFDEVMPLLSAMQTGKEDFDAAKLKEICDEADTDNSGEIDFAEFLHMMILINEWAEKNEVYSMTRKSGVTASIAKRLNLRLTGKKPNEQSSLKKSMPKPHSEDLEDNKGSLHRLSTVRSLNKTSSRLSTHQQSLDNIHNIPFQRMARKKFASETTAKDRRKSSETSLQQISVKQFSAKNNHSEEPEQVNIHIGLKQGRPWCHSLRRVSADMQPGSQPGIARMKRSAQSEMHLNTLADTYVQSKIKKSPSDTSLYHTFLGKGPSVMQAPMELQKSDPLRRSVSIRKKPGTLPALKHKGIEGTPFPFGRMKSASGLEKHSNIRMDRPPVLRRAATESHFQCNKRQNSLSHRSSSHISLSHRFSISASLKRGSKSFSKVQPIEISPSLTRENSVSPPHSANDADKTGPNIAAIESFSKSKIRKPRKKQKRTQNPTSFNKMISGGKKTDYQKKKRKQLPTRTEQSLSKTNDLLNTPNRVQLHGENLDTIESKSMSHNDAQKSMLESYLRNKMTSTSRKQSHNKIQSEPQLLINTATVKQSLQRKRDSLERDKSNRNNRKQQSILNLSANEAHMGTYNKTSAMDRSSSSSALLQNSKESHFRTNLNDEQRRALKNWPLGRSDLDGKMKARHEMRMWNSSQQLPRSSGRNRGALKLSRNESHLHRNAEIRGASKSSSAQSNRNRLFSMSKSSGERCSTQNKGQSLSSRIKMKLGGTSSVFGGMMNRKDLLERGQSSEFLLAHVGGSQNQLSDLHDRDLNWKENQGLGDTIRRRSLQLVTTLNETSCHIRRASMEIANQLHKSISGQTFQLEEPTTSHCSGKNGSSEGSSGRMWMRSKKSSSSKSTLSANTENGYPEQKQNYSLSSGDDSSQRRWFQGPPSRVPKRAQMYSANTNIPDYSLLFGPKKPDNWSGKAPLGITAKAGGGFHVSPPGYNGPSTLPYSSFTSHDITAMCSYDQNLEAMAIFADIQQEQHDLTEKIVTLGNALERLKLDNYSKKVQLTKACNALRQAGCMEFNIFAAPPKETCDREQSESHSKGSALSDQAQLREALSKAFGSQEKQQQSAQTALPFQIETKDLTEMQEASSQKRMQQTFSSLSSGSDDEKKWNVPLDKALGFLSNDDDEAFRAPRVTTLEISGNEFGSAQTESSQNIGCDASEGGVDRASNHSSDTKDTNGEGCVSSNEAPQQHVAHQGNAPVSSVLLNRGSV